MPSIILTLFLAGLVTILLPCILPLLPIVLGVSIAERNRWRPLVLVIGMIVSFVGTTFLLQVVLSQFIELSDYIRIGTSYVLFLFGLGFLFQKDTPRFIGAVLGSMFFLEKGWPAVVCAAIGGLIAMACGGKVAAAIQRFGSDVQQRTRMGLQSHQLLSALLIGMTMGLVWVPCAGPALGFALSVVRDAPGLAALLYLGAYGVGAGIPLLLIGYGGQAAVHSVRTLSRYSERIKQVSGALLLVTAIGFRYNLFQDLQARIAERTGYGALGTMLEEQLFLSNGSSPSISSSSMPYQPQQSSLPVLGAAPAHLVGLGPWHNLPAGNGQPFDLPELRGKVVLVDFWTYSCINCIRTLPYMEAMWEKYKNQPFVLLGVHTPEFVFEKSESNVAAAIKKHGLTYPVAQDNDFGTWNAFENHYWPAKYLIDAEGNIRYEHFGEGDYEETSEAVAALLAEIGAKADSAATMPAEEVRKDLNLTRETYLHSRSWESFTNAAGGPSAEIIAYTAPDRIQLHLFSLDGMWQLVDDERQVLRSDEGEIRIRALGGEVNLVLGLEEGKQPVEADIFVDGVQKGSIKIQDHDLYNLFTGPYGEHDIVLKIHGKGAAAYAFTFGS